MALTLSLAANIGSFAVIDTVLLRVLPVEDLERLVHVWDNVEISPGKRQSFSVKPANYLEWKKRQTTMARLGAFEPLSFNLTGVGEPVRLQGALISHDLLPTFGVEPILGRGISERDDRPGVPPVALLGHDLWKTRFGADPGVVGRQILVDGLEHEVVGVLPAGFYHPWHSEIWISLRLDPQSPKMQLGLLTVIGFLKPGVTIEQARADFRAVATQLEHEFPDTNTGWEIEVPVLRDQLVGDIQPKLLWIFAGSCLLLVAGCTPLARLLGAGARGEPSCFVAVLPSALGLAAAAGICGYLLALAGTETVVGTSPLVIFTSYYKTIYFGALVALYALGIVLASALLLAALGNRLARTPMRGGWQRLAVAIPATIFLATLLTAAVTASSYWRQANADYGLRIPGLLSLRISLPESRYADPQKRRELFAELLTRVRQLPGVTSAGVSTDTPFDIHTRSARHSVEGHATEPGTVLVTHHRLVSPDYLETLGVELVEGRTLSAGDTWDAPRVVVVNRSFAERFWPAQSALGKRVKQGAPDSSRPWLTVVGVIRDLKEDGREPIDRPSWYLPAAQYDDLQLASLVVRAQGDALALAPEVRRELAAIDSEQPVYDVLTVEQLRDRFTLFRPRFVAILSGLAAGLALVIFVATLAAHRAACGRPLG